MRKELVSPLLALAVAAAPSLACIHMPRDYAGSAEQTAQEAIVFWADGREILLLKNDFRIDPGADGQLPSHLAWVVPVPNEPDGYAVEDVTLFRDMFQAWEEVQRSMMNSKGEDGQDRAQGGIELLAKAKVGEYEIQPIRARGDEGGKALNAWLAENGFGEIAADRMAWYLERQWVWLAVKVSLASGESELVRNGSLRPLRIAFASEEIVYPLLFSAGQGTFDVNLYVVTRDGIEDLGGKVEPYGFALDGLPSPMDLPASVEAVQEKAAREGKWKVLDRPHVHKLVGKGLNGEGKPLSGWKEDFRIALP